MQDLIDKIQALTETYWGYSLEREVEKLLAEEGWTVESKEMSWSGIYRPIHQHPAHGDWSVMLLNTSDPQRFRCMVTPVDGDYTDRSDEASVITFSLERVAQIKEFQQSILAQYQPDPYEDCIADEV